MRFFTRLFGVIFFVFLFELSASSNPYWDPSKLPSLEVNIDQRLYKPQSVSITAIRNEALESLRVEISWSEGEIYQASGVHREKSGTPALLKRSRQYNKLGSYKGFLIDRVSGDVVAQDAIGTGKEFRKLTRALTFRFPLLEGAFDIRVVAENPVSGLMEQVLQTAIEVPEEVSPPLPGTEVKQLAASDASNPLRVVFYSESYTAKRKNIFFEDAQRAVQVLKAKNWPGFEKMEFYAVFGASNTMLGPARKLGLPVQERDSFLGLYYPYWNDFGRYYNVIYPTREARYRRALGQVPYDYPIVLVDSSVYFGVGNFNEIVAVPSRHSQFVFVLLHELGHYFGLNEEYEGGGRTELEFAENIPSPWSQNMSFERNLVALKWREFVDGLTPIPTPSSIWNNANQGPVGAYRGGYADSHAKNKNHKPVMSCTMSTGETFCPVCRHALLEKLNFDIGEP